MTDLQAAASRLRADFTEVYSRDDVILLAKAWLAEHPADDGEPSCGEQLPGSLTAEDIAEMLRMPLRPHQPADDLPARARRAAERIWNVTELFLDTMPISDVEQIAELEKIILEELRRS